MSATWKTVRVFISSTFRDMQSERDWLVRFVFPKLRQELVQRRIHLVDVDLRWGVTSEQDALSVCREVVDECRPRFLCMLGGRYGWVPPGKTRSITADEVYYGVLDRDLKSRGFASFYFRDPSATAAMVEVTPGEFCEPAGSHGADALAELKTAIAEAGLQPFIYRAQWDDQSRRLIGLKEFGDRVYEDLKQSIDQEFGSTTGEKPDEFTEENAAMEAFIEERVQRFVLGSRESVLNELLAHANSTGGNGYVCLTGVPGSGKSALLAKFCQLSTLNPQPLVAPKPGEGGSTILISHFVGASAGSTDVRRTLRRLCHELVTGAELTTEIPEDPEKLRVAFAEILQQAAAKKRVVILLDAINQFDPSTQLAGWSWLPEELPATTRIILSTLSEVRGQKSEVSGQSSVISDQQTVLSPQSSVVSPLDALRHRRIPPREIELQPLTAEDAGAIIWEFLHRYRKSMTDDQRAALLAKADAGTPLYLLVALEELRTLGTYEEIADRIAQLPPETRALFIWILKRLEDDDGFRDASGQKIGRELVSRFVSLLGASRHGLSQQELVELLSPGDPQGNVAALAQLLRPYLMQRGELLDFYHGQFREAAATAYLPSESQRLAAHGQLATYFRHKADPERNQSWNGNSRRPFVELPFHLARANFEGFVRLLLTFTWVQAKTNKALVDELLQDYDEAIRAISASHTKKRALELAEESLRLSSHVLRLHPAQLASHLAGRLSWFDIPTIRTLLRHTERHARNPWLRLLTPSLNLPGGPLHRTLDVCSDPVLALAILDDGTHIISCHGGYAPAVKIWDMRTGVCEQRLTGHTDDVWSVAVSADSRRAVTSSSDGTLRVWNLRSGNCERVLIVCVGKEKDPLVRDSCRAVLVAMTEDGQLAVSGSPDGVVRLWDLNTGRCIGNLRGHRYGIDGLSITADGKRAATRSGCEVVLWDLKRRARSESVV